MSSPQALKRELGVGGAVLLGLSSMIGTGVFVSLGFVILTAGQLAWLAVLLAAGLATCNALSSAQLAAAHPVSGGAYEYGSHYLHPLMGFSAGWMFLCAKSATAAAACLTLAAAATAILPSTEIWMAPATALAITLIAATGLRKSNRVNMILISFVTLSLLICCFFIWVSPPPQASTTEMEIPLNGLLPAAALAFVAFTGYGRIATMGEEIRDPKKSIPRAVIWTVLATTVLYLGITITAGTYLTPTDWDAVSPLLLPLLSEAPTWSRSLLLAAATVCLISVLLNLILGLSRVILAMARRGHMPAIFKKVSSGSGGPVRAVWASGLAIALCASVFSVYDSWTFSARTVLLYYGVMNACALRLPAESRLYPAWISVLGLLGCIVLAFLVPGGTLLPFLMAVGVGGIWLTIFKAKSSPTQRKI